jgi:large repetitive protein
VYLGASTCDGSTSAAVAAPVFGQPQTLTARVTGATAGRVDFFDGQNFIGSAAVNASGAAALTFASNLGAHRYRAVFAATDAADTSASGWLSQSVAKATPTVTLSVAKDGTVRASVRAPFGGAPIGTVTFKAGNVVLGTVSVDGNGVATFRPAGRVAPGRYQVTAVYSGSSCFLGTSSDPFDLVV